MGDAGGEGRPALTSALQDPVRPFLTAPAHRRRYGALLWPATDPRMSRLGSAAVLLAAFVVALLRLPADIAFDTMWAEDGALFLTQAAREPFSAVVLRDYAGYAHVAARTAATVISWLPLEYAAIGFACAAAAVQATSALVGYVVVRAHRRARGPALLVAAAVALVPVGPEVVLNISNIQWFLLFSGVAAQLWTPRTVAGRGLQLGLGVLLVLSCPFGFLAVGVAVLRAVVCRTRWDLASAAVLLGGWVVQLAVMASAAGGGRMTPQISADPLVAGYVRRVLGDGLLGIGPEPVAQLEPSVTAGLVLLAVFAVLLALDAARHGVARQLPVLALVVLSYLAYAPPVVLTGQPAVDLVLAGRYFVAPALLWILAFALVLPTAEKGRPWGGVGRLATAAFAVVLVSGWYSSWAAPQQLRGGLPRWSEALDLGRDQCREVLPTTLVSLSVTPPLWTADVPCPAVERSGGAIR